jgi:outer membrane protein assembly factor BamB
VNGKQLWTLAGSRGWGIVNPPDLFVADGVVWYGQGNLHAESITGYDVTTGEPARTVDLGMLITRGHHARCYRSKATDNYLLLPKRAVEFVDIKGGPHSRYNWVRGACRYGVLPCNGLLYSTPHPCFCYAGVKLGGFLALAGELRVEGRESRVEGKEPRDGDRLQRGPAYSRIENRKLAVEDPNAWLMYRHDAKRSGSASTVVDANVRPLWKTELGGKLTQPVVVDRHLFAARVDAGQVCCLDAITGQSIWTYIAGGRIDSSPTICTFVVPPSGGTDEAKDNAAPIQEPPKGGTTNSFCLFGSADGYVYCLRASDGVLAWRFRAAPDERRVVAFGQIESAWPVHGSVLIVNDTAYFAAGRSSFLDGGIMLYGIDPITGRKRYETRLDGPDLDTKVLDENAYAMEGAKSDILVTDGTLIYLFHNAFNERLEKQPTPIKGALGVRNLGERDFGRHLFSNAGFLDDSWFSRSYWMVGDQWPAFNFAHQSPKAGQLVVFDDTATYAVKCFARRNMLSPLFFPATDGYFLVADRNETQPVLVSSDGKGGPEFMRWLPQTGELQTCWNLGVGFARAEPAKWVSNVPVRIRAMVRTAGALFAAGPPDVCESDDPVGALEGRKGAVLLAFDLDDGKKLLEHKMDTPPVFDGMSAAAGRLYVATMDGSIMCLGGR